MIVSPVAILHFPAFLKGSYGLFRSMTGVGGRPELVLEGASELHGPWMEIPFKYKPGSVERPCSFIGIWFKQLAHSSNHLMPLLHFFFDSPLPASARLANVI